MNTIERISGKITDDKGRATEGVIGTMDVTLASEGQSGNWRGELKLPLDTSIAAGPFTLTLDNGRSGRIIITAVRANTGTKYAAPFIGSGPPPT